MADLSRREVLVMAAAGAMSLGAGASRSADAPVDLLNMPVGLELYPLLAELGKDPDGTLRKVAEIGFQRVELPGLSGAKPQDTRERLTQAGLSCISAGTLPNPVVPGMASLETQAERIFAEFRELGLTYIVNLLPPLAASRRSGPPMAAFDAMTVEHWREAAVFLNEMGRKARDHGLRLAHHNHHWEFAPVGQWSGFDILLRETDPAYVEFEMDCAWVAAMGVDPAETLQRHRDRIPLLHLKDIEARRVPGQLMQTVAVGQGIIDWRQVFSAMRGSRIKQYYIELDPPFKKPVFESLEDSYRYVVSGLKRLSVPA